MDWFQKLKIKRLERKYRRFIKKRDKYDPNGRFRKVFIKYTKKAEVFENEIYKIIMPILKLENIEFIEISKENMTLFRKGQFKFKVRASGATPASSYATALKGVIRKNGLAYCKTTSSNISVSGITDMMFPSKYVGSIDCIGNVILRAGGVGFALIRTLPQNYVATISQNGTLNLEVDKNNNVYSGQSTILSEIIGNPFASREDAERFFENRKKLMKIMDDYRASFV